MVSRLAMRRDFPVGERLSLAENDLDSLGAAVDSMRRLLMGILVSTTSASLLVAVNIAIQFAGK